MDGIGWREVEAQTMRSHARVKAQKGLRHRKRGVHHTQSIKPR
jgi:hypothetical protein